MPRRDTLHIALDAAVTKTASYAPPANDYSLDRFSELVITLNITAAERTTAQTYDFYVITGDGSSEWDLVHFPQIAVAGATKLTARVLSSLLPQTVTLAAPGVAAIAPAIINTLTTNAPKTLGAGQVAHGPWGNYLRYELVCGGTITTGITYTLQVEAAWSSRRNAGTAAATAAVEIFTYYVDSVGGLDANPGTSALPWKTIAKVNSTVGAGQSVGFRRGTTIAGQLIPAANGITYGAYGSGALPVINGAGQTQCIGATARNNLTILDLRLTAGGTYGLAANTVNGLTIAGVEVDNANSSGILLGNGTQTVNIANCLIHNNGIGASGDRDGIGIGGGGAAPHDIVIQDCDIYANFHDGVRVSMTSAFNTPSNVTISNNKTRNQTTGSGIAADACTNLTVVYNLVTNNAGVGIYIVPANISGNVENVTGVIYHNTVVGNLWGMSVTNGGGGTLNVTAKNNLFQNNGTSGSSAEMALTTLTTWVSDYNLVWHPAGGNFMYGAGFMSWATWKTTVSPHDANSKNSDPLLNPDYTLQAGSPALGAGVFIAGVSTANPPNIGAK